MDHSDQSQQPSSRHNQQPGSGTMSPIGTPAGVAPSPQHQHLTFNQAQHFQSQQQQHHLLRAFWDNQMQEIDHAVDFKNHSLPLARIKKIMKADEDVRMISAEAPVVFAKACEIFVLELTLRSWIHTEENKRRTLQKNDIAAAVSRNDVFDFLVDIIPRDELKEEGLGIGSGGEALQYYCVPAASAAVDHASALYGGRPGNPFMPWTQGNSGRHPSQQTPPTERQPGDS